MSHVVCLINVEADRATFTWSEGPASFEPYTLGGMVYRDFREIAAEARERLADLVKDYLIDEQRMPTSAFALAEAGHELYQAIFRPGAEQARQARQVRKWLEQLAQQHEVDTLEIVVESPWSLPWNIIYDQQPVEEAFLSGDETADRWKPFWGLRYNLAGGRKVDPLRRMPLLKEPKVLLVVDHVIRDGLPKEQQKRLTDFADIHQLNVVHNKDELHDAVKAERPDLLYWMSHADADALVLGGEPISPRNMRNLLSQDDDEQFGGLAFLNACQTAEEGKSGSFFEAFHNVGFAGMIGTEHQTVDQFANPLGLDFLEAFLDRGEPVGSVLRKLRGRVPLGLLYGTYCPPDIRVDQGDLRDSVDISQVHVQGVALAVDEAATRTLAPLPNEPYLSLNYYDREDQALFAGRDVDVQRFATILDDSSTRILVLHGESGVGKSSFLRAGVIPYLEEECLGYQFLRGGGECDEQTEAEDSVLIVRCTNHPFCQLSKSLFNYCTQPHTYKTPLGEIVEADLTNVLREFLGDTIDPPTLNAALRNDRTLLGRILAAMSDRLPFAPVLVIDQCEELFTLSETLEDTEARRLALDMLRKTVQASGDLKLIVALRTEYYGRIIDGLRRGLHDTSGIRDYLLTDFDDDEMLEAIRRPTLRERIPSAEEIPFDKYGFRYAKGVDEQIARDIVRFAGPRRDSVLPLMQVICAQLYDLVRRREDKTITAADLESLGGIEGGVRKHVDRLVHALTREHPSDRTAFRKLFTQLYLRQPDNTLTTALLSAEEVSRRWTGRMPFESMLQSAEAKRLLRVNFLRIERRPECRYVSLGHDSLAKIASEWDDELAQGARNRRTTAALVLVSTVAILMAVLAVSVAKLSDNLMKETALNSASQQAQFFLNVQEYYAKLKLIDTDTFIDSGEIAIDDDHKLLVPAQFTMELGEHIDELSKQIDDIKKVPMKAKLYSDYPWFGKKPQMDVFDEFALNKLRKLQELGGRRPGEAEEPLVVHNFDLDQDDKDALESIRKERDEPVDESTYDPNKVLRYALALKMGDKTCLDCHNGPVAPTRIDLQPWEAGDVRGALGITRRLEADKAATKSLLWTTLILVGIMAAVLLILSGAVLVVSSRRRSLHSEPRAR